MDCENINRDRLMTRFGQLFLPLSTRVRCSHPHGILPVLAAWGHSNSQCYNEGWLIPHALWVSFWQGSQRFNLSPVSHLGVFLVPLPPRRDGLLLAGRGSDLAAEQRVQNDVVLRPRWHLRKGATDYIWGCEIVPFSSVYAMSPLDEYIWDTQRVSFKEKLGVWLEGCLQLLRCLWLHAAVKL